MHRSLTAKHGTTLIGLCALIGGATILSGVLQPALAHSPAVPLGGIPGIGPGTGVDVYIPNPDAQPPIAWSQGTEPPPPQGDYGGGFVQYLITGNESRPQPRPNVPPPYYPQIVAPLQSARGIAQGRYRPELGSYARPMSYGAPAGPAPQVYGRPVSSAPPPVYGQPVAYAPQVYARPAAYAAQPVQAEVDPIYRRQEVAFGGPQGAGTILIDTANKFLYLVEGSGRALRYGIGVGRPGFLWAGEKTITRKAEWPDWTPPSDMLLRRPDLPRHMEGGIENPLGARAMYLGSSLYRIHGTNEPNTIGTNVSSGCIRLTNDDVADLYGRVRVGTHVFVM